MLYLIVGNLVLLTLSALMWKRAEAGPVKRSIRIATKMAAVIGVLAVAGIDAWTVFLMLH